jgi:hypothetical protein
MNPEEGDNVFLCDVGRMQEVIVGSISVGFGFGPS